MNTTRLFWQVQLTSMRSVGRHDKRMRIAVIVIFLLDIAVGLWSGNQLVARITHWQMQGAVAVQAGMLSVCLLVWVGISGIAMLEGLQQGISDDTAQLLFTLPIAPATHFRAMYSTFFLRRLWNWLFLEMGITGVALVMTLGWEQALVWLVLLQLGVGCVVYLSLMTVLLFLCSIFSFRREKIRYGLAIVLSCGVVAVAWWLWHPATITVSFVVSWLSPQVVSLALIAILAIAMGPLAEPAGALYTAAFLAAQNLDRSRKHIGLPGIQTCSEFLRTYRTLTSALFVKGLLSQSRNVLFWGRIIVMLLALFFFPWIRNALTPYHITDVLLIVGYTSGLVLLTMLEQASGALSSEGNRLTLYLITPLKLATILRARLIVFLLPTLITSLGISLALGLRVGLPFGEQGFASITVLLIITGCTTLPVWGSVWDENLNLVIEGTIQMMMQEEAAITPKRIGLLNVSLLLFVSSLLLVWKFPPLLALSALMLLDGITFIVMHHFGHTQLRQLLRRG